jgi:hypothetical protein
MHIGYWWEIQNEKVHWEDQDVGGWTILKSIVTVSRYAECHCYPTAGYIVAAAGVTEFPEICAVATQRKPGFEFHIRSND